MILKFIHDNFALDLVHHEFALIEENNWFSNTSFSKYTYPVEIELTNEQYIAMGFVTDQNLKERTTVFPGRFYAMNEAHEAVLEIEKMIGRKITAQIRYGFEELSNGEKKLSELPLEDFPITEGDIFEFAEDEIDNTFPDKNYCFPKVHTDHIDKEQEQWQYFEGAVNNYKSGAMLINEYDDVEDLQINRNIVQPMPFVLHVLKKGFEDAGYTLSGDILEIELIRKMFIYHLSTYYRSFNNQAQELYVQTDDYDTLIHHKYAVYHETIVLPEPGRYIIAGNIILRTMFASHPDATGNELLFGGVAYTDIHYNGSVIWKKTIKGLKYKEVYKTIEVVIDFYGDEGDINLISGQLPYAIIDEITDDEAVIMDLTITQLTKYDTNGDPLPTLIVPNEIKLQKCVPDITFGKLVETIQKQFNLDTTVNANDMIITMNRILPQLNTAQAVGLNHKEVKTPEIEFNQGKSYILKYQDVESEEYEFPSIYVDINGTQVSPFIKKQDTEEIVIDALPLPLTMRNEDFTALDFIDDNARLFLGLYDGLQSGKNHCLDPSPLSILSLYETEYEEWLIFLLQSLGYNWSFTTTFEEAIKLHIKSVIYAYKQYHVITRLTRSNITPKIIHTEIETKSLV